MTLDDVNQSYRSLIALLRGLDPGVAFTLANSVWYRPSLTLTPEFVDAAQTYFGARVQSLDFATPTAAPTINGWVSDQTRGKIPAIVPDPVPDDVVAYLINAIYFKGDWTMRFDPARTTPGPFTLANGAQTSVPMMTRHVMSLPPACRYAWHHECPDRRTGGRAGGTRAGRDRLQDFAPGPARRRRATSRSRGMSPETRRVRSSWRDRSQ